MKLFDKDTYKRPLYQVLALDGALQHLCAFGESAARTDIGTLAIDKILAKLTGGAP